MGNRQACICKDLTKVHEEIIRGRLSDIIPHISDKTHKGEFVVLIAKRIIDGYNFFQEKKKVRSVSEYANTSLKQLEKKLEEVGSDNLAKLSELREEGEFGPDFLMFLEQLHEKNESFNLKDKLKRQI